MTLAQLDELLKLKAEPAEPDARSSRRTSPSCNRARTRTGGATASSRWRTSNGLQKFVDRLAPVHNSLKAHVLYHRLAFDRAQGVYDKARFLAYLKLPRLQPYMARAWNERDRVAAATRPT